MFLFCSCFLQFFVFNLCSFVLFCFVLFCFVLNPLFDLLFLFLVCTYICSVVKNPEHLLYYSLPDFYDAESIHHLFFGVIRLPFRNYIQVTCDTVSILRNMFSAIHCIVSTMPYLALCVPYHNDNSMCQKSS